MVFKGDRLPFKRAKGTNNSMLQIVILCLLLPLAALAQSGAPGPCLLTVAEISSALGVSAKEARPGLSMNLGPATMQDCRYKLAQGGREFTLMLKTMRYTRTVTPAQHFESLAGRLTPVPGDPDGARFQEGQGDLTDPALHYFRGGVGVELRLMGTWYTGTSATPKELDAWRKKLATVRRVP